MTLPGLVAANNLNDVADQEKAWDNLGSNVSASIPISAPSLDLNFASNKSLIDDVSGQNLITFSRASTGTFIGSNGLLQTAASGVPRFDHDPVTGESLGLLIEESRTNYFTSSTPTSADWGQYNSSSITDNQATGPNGVTNSASLVTFPATGGAIPIIGASSAGVSGTVTVSMYVRAVTGTVSLQVGTNISYGTTQIVGTSWTRIQFTTSTLGSSAGLRSGDVNSAQNFYAWGAQLEVGSFPTSHIPTSGGTATRATEFVSILGADYTSVFGTSLGSGTIFTDVKVLGEKGNTQSSSFSSFSINSNNAFTYFTTYDNRTTVGITTPNGNIDRYRDLTGVRVKAAVSWTDLEQPSDDQDNASHALDGTLYGGFQYRRIGPPLNTEYDRFGIGRAIRSITTYNSINGHISRLTYYPTRFADVALQYLSSASGSPSSTTYPYTFTIKGKDTLALNSVSNASIRDFVFIKGLLSLAQPRLTVAAQNTTSGTVLRDYAMPKLSPTTAGNYFFSSSFALSGTTLRVNGTNALSIATSPFSGSTAIAPLLLEELRPQSNWRITEPMPSGALASPEFAIPYETNDFVLFMKAGQN